jgi:hypothetical protein
MLSFPAGKVTPIVWTVHLRWMGVTMPEREHERALLTAEEVFEPWELSGESRYDCEPHRARLLAFLAYGSLVAGSLSFVCFFTGLVGLPLGLVAWSMARRDLDRISAGDMDQNGYHPTEKARSNAQAGVFLNLLGMFCCGIPLWGFMSAPKLDGMAS